MNPVLITFVAYLLALLLIGRWLGGRQTDNKAFYLAGGAVPWWVVAVGMLGDSISGVTFVSVPGMVRAQQMTYLQLCFGFFLGYLLVAYVLLPLYYRLRLVSIYQYLGARFGPRAYRTGAGFFVLSKIFGAAAKLYLVTLILQTLVFEALGVPYPCTVASIVAVVWLYTRSGGMNTIVWTDVLQTLCLLVALVLIIGQVGGALNLSVSEMVNFVCQSPHSRVWVWDDWASPTHALKQLVGGAFIVVVMTGLDQNMMQKNLTCRTLGEARKNMLVYGFGFIPLNFLFLALGILLLAYAEAMGIALPAKGDEILPLLAAHHLGTVALVCFTLGVTAAAFSNADSALTSLTTSICVDLLGLSPDAEGRSALRLRHGVHALVCVLFAIVILLIAHRQEGSVLMLIYKAVSYTYGPLLGLYAFGLFSSWAVKDRAIPWVCLSAPLLTYAAEWLLLECGGYRAGYEILLLNGAITALGLWFARERSNRGVYV